MIGENTKYCKTCGALVYSDQAVHLTTRALDPHHILSVEHSRCRTNRLDREIDELSGLNDLEEL